MRHLNPRRLIVCISIGLAAVAPGALSATTKELEKAVINAVPWDAIYVDEGQRRVLAEAIRAYWEEFSSHVPRLSPAESEWLTTELGGQGERLERAINSREFALREVSDHAINCVANARNVLEALDSPEKRETEMFYWAKLINCYVDASEIQAYLRQAGLIPSSGDDSEFVMQVSGITRGKIINVVLPSSMADTMGWTIEKN